MPSLGPAAGQCVVIMTQMCPQCGILDPLGFCVLSSSEKSPDASAIPCHKNLLLGMGSPRRAALAKPGSALGPFWGLWPAQCL